MQWYRKKLYEVLVVIATTHKCLIDRFLATHRGLKNVPTTLVKGALTSLTDRSSRCTG